VRPQQTLSTVKLFSLLPRVHDAFQPQHGVCRETPRLGPGSSKLSRPSIVDDGPANRNSARTQHSSRAFELCFPVCLFQDSFTNQVFAHKFDMPRLAEFLYQHSALQTASVLAALTSMPSAPFSIKWT
jgi:hypothetical protein